MDSSAFASPSQPLPAVVTIWFVSTSTPQATIAANPAPDPGFGRKLLSHLFPATPVSTIGTFPLGRSAQPGTGEYYVGGFPGLTVISTLLDDARFLSQLPVHLLGAVGAPEVYVFSHGTTSSLGGIAHVTAGSFQRVFSATADYVFENSGLPESFELDFWARDAAGINLPFAPTELIPAAQAEWLGTAAPDVRVIGFATDGRPEPRLTLSPPRRSVQEVITQSSVKLGISETNAPYDDYADRTRLDLADEPPGVELVEWGRAAKEAMSRRLHEFVGDAAEVTAKLKEKLRHLDKPGSTETS